MNIEALLADRDWVRRLARSLARDDAQADDLAQDGWVAALRNPPGLAVRAWWRRVLRRRAMEVRRAEDRRVAREAQRDQPRPVGPELLERLELEQAVAQAVRDLPEHYRDVVLLRYFEELPPRAIAKRLAAPVETVRTRLRRAHEILRERLGEVRRDWRAGMLLLAWPGPLLGGFAVETKKVAAGALALCLLLLAGLVWRGAEGNQETQRTSTAPGTAPAPVTSATSAAEDPRPRDTRAPRGAVFGRIAGPLPVLEGTEPLATIRVLRGKAELAAGRFPPGPFHIEYDRAEGSVAEVHAPGTRMLTFALPSAETDLGEIRFYQALLYGGRVLDLEGHRIVGASVRFRNAGNNAVSGPSGDDGRYRIDLDGSTHVCLDPHGNLSGDLLDVRVAGGWLGPYYASPAGFRGKHDLRVDLAEAEPDPVLRIVSGERPVAGVTVTLHGPQMARSTLCDPFATGVTGDDGCASFPWLPERNWALARIERPEGTVYASLLRDEVARPVHDIDIGRLAHVAVDFVLPDGKPADGARVGLHGMWRPHTPGKPVSSPRAQSPAYEPGAVAASLYGIVPADGIVRWCFPVEQPAEGTFTLDAWLARLPNGRVFMSESVEARAVRSGDGPVRIVLEPGPSAPFLWAQFRDSRGAVVPESAGLLLRAGKETLAGGIYLGEAAGDRIQCWLPYSVSECLDGPGFDAELRITVAGRPPATVHVPAAQFRAAVREEAALTVEIGETMPAAFRVARPNGEPAKRVFLTLVPMDADHLNGGRLETITDDAGGAVLNCPADLAHAVVAFDLATGEGVRMDDFRAGGAARDLVLETPRRTRVRVVFPDGAPAPKATVDVETRPRYLAPVLYGITGEDGWAELPRVVPAIFVLNITACDRRLMRKDAEGRPQLPMITHSTLIPMASVNDGDTVTVPMRDDVAWLVAEGK